MSAFLLFLLAFCSCLCCSAAQAVDTQEPLRFEISHTIPPSTQHSILVTFFGKNFTEKTSVVLSTNTSGCNTGVYYNAFPSANSEVFTWSLHSPRDFFVTAFNIKKAQEEVYVCYTRDGHFWHSALSHRLHPYFRVWSNIPSAFTIPTTVVATHPVRFVVTGGPVTPSAQGVLVIDHRGCDGYALDSNYILPGGNVTTFEYDSKTFSFTPLKEAETVYLCVALGPHYRTWSIIPIELEPYDNVVVYPHSSNDQRISTRGITPKEGATTVHPGAGRHKLGYVTCTTTIAGVEVTCTVSLSNTSEVTLAPADLSFLKLTDGAGVEECPPPTLHQVPSSTTKVFFKWVPQRAGRLSTLSMLYQGNRLLFSTNSHSEEYYVHARAPLRELNDTRRYFAHPGFESDMGVVHFVIQLPFSSLDNYAYTNHLNLHWFQPHVDWLYRYGVPNIGRQNGTMDGEYLTVTLHPSVTTGAMSQTIPVPSGAEKCRLVIHYNVAPEIIDDTVTNFVGRVSMVVQDSTPADLFTVRSYSLYLSGRRVIVTGGDRVGWLDGDMNVMEQLVAELPVIRSTYAFLRVELEAYHGLSRSIYFANPEVKCQVAPDPRTPLSEVAALERLYTHIAVPGVSSMNGWKNTAAGNVFNGDPCQNQWKGVECRHFRVVGLHLRDSKLAGFLPPIAELSALETLDLSHNELVGDIPRHLVNLTRLRHVDLSYNRFESVPDTLFHPNFQQCIHTIQLSYNKLTHFPQHVVDLPRLHTLDMGGNVMRSTMPNFPPSSVLQHLRLYQNEFHGTLPSLPSHSLVSVDFSANWFNGSIPEQYGTLRNIQYLDLSQNDLSFYIPSVLSKIRTADLLTFRAEGNRIKGLLPQLPFYSMDVRNNMFHCPLPLQKAWAVLPIVGLESNLMQCDYVVNDYLA